MKILIVEDEAKTGDYLRQGLAEAGFTVDLVRNGLDGMHEGLAGEHDLLILDVNLPGLDGWQVLKALRAAGRELPVLFLTARDQVEDRVKGLELGADDYLVKPFAFSELAARLNALARRPVPRGDDAHLLRVGDIVLDLHRRTVERAGRRVTLQPREFALLAELMRNPRRVMTRTMLLERVWDFDFDPKTNIVETHLSRLRSKLNAGFDVDAIETVRGAGYMIRDA